MAKGSPDPCILCEQIKCRCGKPEVEAKPRKAAPKKRTPASPVAVTPQPVEQVPSMAHVVDSAPTQRESARAAMKARAARSRAAQPVRNDDDRVMEDALRALAPILAPDEKANRKDVLWSPGEAAPRALAWRQRVFGE